MDLPDELPSYMRHLRVWRVSNYHQQIELLADRFRILIPDRSGYGRSTKVDHLAVNFHQQAAFEMVEFLDVLGIEKAILWGHSDGAVIAALMGLMQPSRCLGLILEAFHYYHAKPGSQEFFQTAVSEPEKLGPDVCRILALEHGEPYWRKLLEYHGRAWLNIAQESNGLEDDFYGGKLSELAVQAIFIHGSQDPRTEQNELLAVRKQLPHIPLNIIEGGGHSPHSSNKTSNECNRLAIRFLVGIIESSRPDQWGSTEVIAMTEAKVRRIDVFFYGLFMDEALLREKGINPQNQRMASVENFSLAIGARATLAPYPGRTVHGVLFSLTHSEVDALYGEASVSVYRPEAVSAQLADGSIVPALCFNLPVPPSIEERDPQYVSKLRAVASRIGLPQDYVSSIQ